MVLAQAASSPKPLRGRGCFKAGLALHTQGSVEWVWLPRARDVGEFLAEEARIHRLPRNAADRLVKLARAAVEVEDLFFGDGEVACLGYYVVRLGGSYKVYVVVAYYSSGGPLIEAVDVEEWATVSRARQLARLS